MKNSISPFSKKVRPSKPFIDYLHITFIFNPNWVKNLKEKYKAYFYEDLKQLTEDIPKENVHYKDNKKNLYSVVRFHNSPDGSIMIYLSKNYSISVHFKGKYFISTNEFKDDRAYLDKKIKIIEKHLLDYLTPRYGMPYFETHVTRIDLAINHYRAKIWDADRQMKFHNSVSTINVGTEKGITTAITMSRRDTNKIYFRCYSKLHQNQQETNFAKFRFNTDDFFRNEWQLGSNILLKLGLKQWKNWIELPYKNLINPKKQYSDNKTFFTLMNYLRKNRDVTFYPQSNAYNHIHTSKQWQKFKREKLKTVNRYEWKRSQAIIGMIRKGANSMTPIQSIGIIEELSDKYPTIIPEEALQLLQIFWNKQNLSQGVVSKKKIKPFLDMLEKELNENYFYSRITNSYTLNQ